MKGLEELVWTVFVLYHFVPTKIISPDDEASIGK